MSFELFLCCYRDGEPAGIDEGRLRKAFGVALASEDLEFNCWHLEFGPEINCCDVFVTRLESDEKQVKALLVSRPVSEKRLWQKLFNIMQLDNVILFFPGGKSPLFACENAIRHFPQDMVDALGKPKIIKNGAEIAAEIEAA